MNGIVLQAEGLRLRRPGTSFCLEVDSLELEVGGALCLIGPNGAGKSTLLSILALLQRPDAGQIRLEGQTVSADFQHLAARRRLALVSQRPRLLHGTVRANIELPLRLRGVKSAERKRSADEWLERLRLTHLTHRPARQLSGGETRRVALARAMVTRPRVLLLDEPVVDLDWEARSDWQSALSNALATTESSLIVATHDPLEIMTQGQRLAVLHSGRLVQTGQLSELRAHPANNAVARLLASLP